MTTLTIPKKLTKKGDLVIIPRKEYEDLLRFYKKPKKTLNEQLNKDLNKAIAEYRSGKFSGPFDNTKDLMKSLRSKK